MDNAFLRWERGEMVKPKDCSQSKIIEMVLAAVKAA
jgi:hypothetical protein